MAKIVRWYFERPRERATSSLPFYCDPMQVGQFAIPAEQLARGEESAVFQLFVTLSMYQALRDVIIMRRQRSMSRRALRVLIDANFVGHATSRHACSMLRSSEAFHAGCDVYKHDGQVDCHKRPGSSCHVKAATKAFNRMGDMGKLPTSAWLLGWKSGLGGMLERVRRDETSPKSRAQLLVNRFAQIHRVGRKLATMFVSALSTPELAPGLTPWFPEVDGNDLVVVDTNVARLVDGLRGPAAPRTYDARARWVVEQATMIDLRAFRPALPQYSPRVVQEAIYVFGSRSNRTETGDPCVGRDSPCVACAATCCPFAPPRRSEHGRLRPRVPLPAPHNEPHGYTRMQLSQQSNDHSSRTRPQREDNGASR